MAEPPLRRRSAHVALLMMQQLLAEADRSLLSGDVGAAEGALDRIGLALDLHRRRQQEDAEGPVMQSTLAASRRIALHRLKRLLTDIDAALATGDLAAVKAGLEVAMAAVEASREVDESTKESGIRTRFPRRSDK